MLQVPCLSPPIYGHSHYKKFWLRQTELKESSIGGSAAAAATAGVACEIMKSSSTTSSPDTSSSKRISGKRRPQMRSGLASSSSSAERIMKVALNESPVSVSPTSSGEDFPMSASGWKRKASNRRSVSDGDGANSSPLSTVENREEDAEGNTPKSFIRSIDNEEDDDDDKFLLPQLNVCQTAEEQLDNDDEEMGNNTNANNNEDPKLLLVRHNMSCDDVSHSSEQTCTAAAGSMDCQTSKCKGIDTDSRQEDNGQESDNENENENSTSSDSDSATSSTSQASDHDDARSHSEKSSFRQYLKRQPKPKTGDETGSPSPKTRQSTTVAAAAASVSVSAAGVENPVSPSSRSVHGMGSSSPAINSHNNVSTRTCKHCGTMKTPLWRNGPLGPKSLCNACGIRLRKARRNNNHEGTGPAPSLSGKRKQGDQATMIGSDRHPYSKKSRVAFSREKREMASIMRLLPHEHQRLGGSSSSHHHEHTSKLFGKSVSKDEEEGAVLLMALSCGLVLA